MEEFDWVRRRGRTVMPEEVRSLPREGEGERRLPFEGEDEGEGEKEGEKEGLKERRLKRPRKVEGDSAAAVGGGGGEAVGERGW